MVGFGKEFKNKKQKITKDEKRNIEKIIHQAFLLHSQGNIQEALKYYKYCIDKGVNDDRIYSNYGLILKSLGNLKQAEKILRKAIEINPNYAMAYSNLGNILKDLGKLKEAENSLYKSI